MTFIRSIAAGIGDTNETGRAAPVTPDLWVGVRIPLGAPVRAYIASSAEIAILVNA